VNRLLDRNRCSHPTAYVAKYWDGLCVFLTDGPSRSITTPSREPSGR
jgi:hypothetical protein